MKEIAAERRRFGYRRIGILLAREGMVMNEKKLFRLYSEERLTVRRRKGRKRAIGSRMPMPSISWTTTGKAWPLCTGSWPATFR